MASSSCTGSDAPAAETVAAEMVKILETAAQLQALLLPALPRNSVLGAILEELQGSVSRASALLGGCGGGGDQGEVSSRKRKTGSGGGTDRRGGCRRRANSSDPVRVVKSKTLDDGQTWRKYGQKQIQSSEHPRSYFRCTHKYDQHCMASRQVQLAEDDPATFVITYFGNHTCRDPAEVVVPDASFKAACDTSAGGGSRLICFGVDGAPGARRTAAPAASFSPPKQEMSGEEEAVSNLTSAASSSSDCRVRTPEAEKMAVATPSSAGGGDVTSDFQGADGGDLDFDFMGGACFDWALDFDAERFFS